MSDILVFSAPVKEDSLMPMVNAGMGAISGWLREEGYDFDQRSLMADCRYLNRHRFREDAVDLSVFTREDVMEYLRGEENEDITREANKLADLLNVDEYDTILFSAKSKVSLLTGLPVLKERCRDKLVVVGGPLTMTDNLEIVRLPFIDYGVVGDGEIPLSNILEHELEGEPLENDVGLVYEEDGELRRGDPYQHPMEMKARPYLKPEILDRLAEVFAFPKRIYPYQVGRGCTQDCSFCNYFENRKFQYKSPEKVVSELKEIKEETGIRTFYFTDSNLMNDPDHVLKIAEKMIEEDLDIEWGGMCIILPRGQEFFDTLAESGCTMLQHGIESASDSVLHRMRKAETQEMIEDTLRKESEAGIYTFGFFITDFVGEDMEEYYETLDFLRRNRYLKGANTSQLIIGDWENQPLNTDSEEFGIEVEEPDYEDFLEETFGGVLGYREVENRSEGRGEYKEKYMQKIIDLYIFGRNYALRNPLKALKMKSTKLYRKDYQDYSQGYV